MQTCSNCSATLDTDSAFCTSCGIPIVQTIHCPKCGGIINADAKFCKFCAFDLSQPIQRAATATSPLPPLSTINPQTQNLPPQVEPLPPFQENPKSTQTEIGVDNPASFISPSGAAFVVICFFLPWLEWSACGIKKTVSGAELANYDGSFLLYPLAGIVSLLAYFIFNGQKKLWKARPFIIISSALALFLLFYKYNSIPSSPEFMGQRISASDLGFEARIGSFGTVIGFILAIIGCAFMSRAIAVAGQTTVTASQTSSLKYDSTLDKDGSLNPNIVAILCYLSPLLLPLGFQLLAAGLMGHAFNPIVVVLIAFALMFCVQIVFLNIKKYKKTPFVRFHAYQSIFLLLVYLGITLVFLGIMALAAKDANPFQPPPLLQFLTFAAMGLGIAQWIISIFMAFKSYKREFYKLPYIGDWAMNRANKDNQPTQANQSNQSFYKPSYVTENNVPPTVESPNFVPSNSTQSAETTGTFAKNSSQNETASPNFSESSQTNTKDQQTSYIVGASMLGLVFLIGIVVWATSLKGDYAPNNANVSSSYSNANSSNLNRSYSNTSNVYVSNGSGNMNSSSTERAGRLTTNLNLRSAPNRTALSVGIHFQNARVKILDEESYDTEDGYSTWYKVAIIEYGCDSQGNLGCGKNSDNDSDEGWVNSKYVVLD